MKLKEVRDIILTALAEGKPAMARPHIDRLRTRGWRTADFNIEPFDYGDLLAFVSEGKPELERATWDAFLFEVDRLDLEAE
jgi:hypothetical protein